MKFKDTTNKQGLIEDIDFLIWGSSNTFHDQYSIEDRTRNINMMYSEVITLLLDADPNWKWTDKNRSKYPVGTIDLVGGRAKYSFPDDIITINRLRIKTKQGNYKTLEPVARRDVADGNLDDSGTPDNYYKIGDAVFLVPEPDYSATSGIEIQIQREPNYFNASDTDKEPGFDRLFHRYLSVGAALRYASSNDMNEKAQQLRAEKQEIAQQIEDHYEGRGDDKKPSLGLKRKNPRHYGLN